MRGHGGINGERVRRPGNMDDSKRRQVTAGDRRRGDMGRGLGAKRMGREGGVGRQVGRQVGRRAEVDGMAMAMMKMTMRSCSLGTHPVRTVARAR